MYLGITVLSFYICLTNRDAEASVDPKLLLVFPYSLLKDLTTFFSERIGKVLDRLEVFRVVRSLRRESQNCPAMMPSACAWNTLWSHLGGMRVKHVLGFHSHLLLK